jgi:hypothetical protein
MSVERVCSPIRALDYLERWDGVDEGGECDTPAVAAQSSKHTPPACSAPCRWHPLPTAPRARCVSMPDSTFARATVLWLSLHGTVPSPALATSWLLPYTPYTSPLTDRCCLCCGFRRTHGPRLRLGV